MVYEALGDLKLDDECSTELDWEEIEEDLKKYPIVRRYIKDDDDLEKIRQKIMDSEIQNIIKREEQNKMANLKDTAQAYEPKITLNVADLEKVDILSEVEDRTGTDDKGVDFSYKVLVINGKDYRTPNTVIEEIKKILSLKPDVKFVKVTKSGSGLNTRYSVNVTA